MNGFLHGLQLSPCFAVHRWQDDLLSLRETSHKITNMVPKTASHRCYPCFHKNSSINITFYPTNVRFFPSTESRRHKIIVFLILQMMNNKPIIPRIVSKLHHFGDAKCSKKKYIVILPTVAQSSFWHIAITLSTTRPCWYALLSRTDSRPAVCQHSWVVVQSKKTGWSYSVVFSHIGQCKSQSTRHWYIRTQSKL
jgi:hypothetical protein